MIKHTGFTLIEVLVSTAIFSMVMVMALGALLALSEADRKAQTLNTAVNNMSAALDSMSRAIRTGDEYECGSGQSGYTYDCPAVPGSTYFSFRAADGTHVAYCLDNSLGYGVLKREIVAAGSSNDAACTAPGFIPLTPPDVHVTNLTFYVIGSLKGTSETPIALQPKVVMLLSGSVAVSASQSSTFNIQTSVTQRTYDQ